MGTGSAAFYKHESSIFLSLEGFDKYVGEKSVQ